MSDLCEYAGQQRSRSVSGNWAGMLGRNGLQHTHEVPHECVDILPLPATVSGRQHDG